MAIQDPIHRLADVLTILQNCPATQQPLAICLVYTTPLTFEGKSKKFEMFEDRFHPMITMQPELSEQM